MKTRIYTPPTRLNDEAMNGAARTFYQAMTTRRTIRDFSDEPVPRDVIETCVMVAGSAPSGANHQPWHFAVIEDPAVKREIRVAAEAEERAFYTEKAPQEWLDALAPLGTDDQKPFLETAPYLIAIFAQKRGGPNIGDDKKNYYISESVGIACGFLIAALHNCGLATLTHTPSPMNFLNRICDRPANEKPYLLLVVGHAATGATVPQAALRKKSADEIISWL
jgi:nitroreductase